MEQSQSRQTESDKTKRKTKLQNKRPLILAVLAAFLLVSIAITFLPLGITWHKLFSLVGLSDFSDAADSSPMSMHVLDVGKADSILIESDGHFMLVDGGTADYGDKISRYLTRRGVKTLDLVVNTHPDEDHIGGLSAVINSFPIQEYFAPGIPTAIVPNSTEYRNVQAALSAKNLTAVHPARGSVRTLGKLKLEVLAPVKQRDTTNNNSIVLRLTYGGTKFLLMGDAEKEEETDLLSSGENLAADVLKVGHHGSSTATTQELLNAVKPRYAVISVRKDSSNLPKSAVLKRLWGVNAQIFRTDVSGTLIFMSDGNKITVQTER